MQFPFAGVPAAPTAPVDETPAGRWSILALLSLAVLLAMSLWFTASASAGHFQALWQLTPGQAGALTTTVQLGFVAGTAIAAVLNIVDVAPARLLFASSALLAAACNALLLVAPSFSTALALRFLTGLLLAGVYPPAMKMAATWFRRARGLAIGTIVGALTIGKAAPYLVNAVVGSVHPRFVIGTTSGGAVLAALLMAATYRDGPFAFPHRPFSWSLVRTVVADRPTRLAIGSYLGHMWELYAMWAASYLMLGAHFAARGASPAESAVLAAVWTFGFIAIGGLGCVLAGAWADRFGRENVAAAAMAVSGACALVIGWLVGSSSWLVLTAGLIWGFAVVADSAQFSALVTEVAPAHAVGTALTLQTSLGFLLTVGSIWLTIRLAGSVGWGVSCSVLALGPAIGIWAILRLRSVRQAGGITTRTG